MFSDDLPPALARLAARARAAGAAAGGSTSGAAAAPAGFEEGTAGAAVQCDPNGAGAGQCVNAQCREHYPDAPCEAVDVHPVSPYPSVMSVGVDDCQAAGVCGLVPGCEYHDRCQAAWAMVTGAGK